MLPWALLGWKCAVLLCCMVTVTGMELSGGSRGAGEKLCQEGGGHGTVTQGCGHGPELPELTVLG